MLFCGTDRSGAEASGEALAAYFLRKDAAAVFFREWSACQNLGLQYSNGDTWERMLQQGIMLLERFCQDDRVRIRRWPSLQSEVPHKLLAAESGCADSEPGGCTRPFLYL